MSKQRAIMNDQQLIPYKKTVSTDNFRILKLKSLGRGKLMLSEREPAASKIFIWSDKKMSTVETVINKKNDRVYALSSGYLPVKV